MEKRFIAALALSVAILLGWSLIAKRLFPPPPAPVMTGPPAEAGPPAAPTPPAAAPSAPEAPLAAAPTVAGVADEEVRLETDLAAIVLTNRGGRVKSCLADKRSFR
jgi:YidC/Oxa1 family membrane protein insertase